MTSNTIVQTGATGRAGRWLVLGAAGQLGREWCRKLEQDGADFRGLTHSDIDITSSEKLRETLHEIRPNIVVNCAAYTNVDQAEREEAKAEKINAVAVGQLACFCAEKHIRLIHYSTDYVFPGLPEHRNRFPDGYPESFPPDPVNKYGRSKWLGEQEVQEAGGSHLIIRVSWLCGRYGKNFIHTMLRIADQKDYLRVVDDQFGCPTFADTVVANSFILIETGVEGIYHLSSQGETSWFEFARVIFELSGRQVTVEPIPTSEYPTLAPRPAWSRLGIKKLSDIPGTRILPWRQELQKYLRSLQ